MQRFMQLSLDFLEAAVAPLLAPRPQPPAHASQPPSSAQQPVASGPAEANLRHPASNREILLGGQRVGYEFKRGKRRTIGFQVGVQGLEVRAPRWVGQAEIDAALHEKSAWILRKLHEMRERQQQRQLGRIEWRDGASLPYLGETLLVVLDPRHGFDGAGAALQVDPATLPGVPRSSLHVGLPQTATAQQIRDAVQAWLMRAARDHFSQRLSWFAPRLGVQWRRLSLSSASTRWGSAGADGSIRLNWRLIHFRPELIDYVVVHELSHLKVMDHSPRFWSTVQTLVPQHARLRAELRDDALPHW
jgi:predicted metal-dependent hydrolase